MTDPSPCALFPPLLPAKGTIGIIAPSRWPQAEMLERTVVHFEARGYEVVVHDQCYLQHGTLAGRDAARAEALNDMFGDATIDAIVCARGGSGGLLVLDRLDYELIRANPKPFIGSSDITVLLQAITCHTGMVTYHGPMGFHFLPERYEAYTEDDLFYMISGDPTERRLRFPMVEVERAGKAEGRLVGGNLSMLQSLIGTAYDWSGDGAILFIEDVNEPLYSIERMMAHMRLAGKFEGIRAVLVGEMVGIPEEKADSMALGDCPYGRTLKEVMLKHLPPEVPIGFNYPCGHGRYLTTLPVGACVRVTITPDLCDVVIPL
ncbi:MAG: LD-carboxypeptidase [Alphaproteobacteria bacterium]|nr:LD-carboxypeptidase [Alphaproteobacteria bacterium]